jgi:hypothetical protein
MLHLLEILGVKNVLVVVSRFVPPPPPPGQEKLMAVELLDYGFGPGSDFSRLSGSDHRAKGEKVSDLWYIRIQIFFLSLNSTVGAESLCRNTSISCFRHLEFFHSLPFMCLRIGRKFKKSLIKILNMKKEC